MFLIGLLCLFVVDHKFDVKLVHRYFQIAAERKSSIRFIFSSLFLISKVDDDNSIEEIYQNLENSALFDNLNKILIFEKILSNGFLKKLILKYM
jgi:hypothetical protein